MGDWYEARGSYRRKGTLSWSAEADEARQETNLSIDGFSVYWVLSHRMKVESPQPVAEAADAAFTEHPHWKTVDSELTPYGDACCDDVITQPQTYRSPTEPQRFNTLQVSVALILCSRTCGSGASSSVHT